MLRKAIFCGLILIAGAALPLSAQTPSPKPSPAPSPEPKPGTRAYTEQQARDLPQLRQQYEQLCKTSKDRGRLEKAYADYADAHSALRSAAFKEAETTRAIREATAERDYKKRRYSERVKDANDLTAEHAAQEELKRAQAKLKDLWDEIPRKIMAVVDPAGMGTDDTEPCPEHKALEKVWNDAATAAAMNRVFEDIAKKKAAKQPAAQKAATGQPKKADDCNRGGGLSGPLEKEACQEGK